MGYTVTKCPCYQEGVNEEDNCFQYGSCEKARTCPIKRILTLAHRNILECKRVMAKKDYYSDEWQSRVCALAEFSEFIYNILGRRN